MVRRPHLRAADAYIARHFPAPLDHSAHAMRLTAAFTSLVALAIGASGASIRDTTASATAMMVVPLDVGNVSLAEFNPFYDTDHIPRVMALPGFLSASRFDSIDGLFPAQTTMYAPPLTFLRHAG